MRVRLHFDYDIDEGTVEEWREDYPDAYVEQRAIELCADLLADWLIDGGIPEQGVNAVAGDDLMVLHRGTGTYFALSEAEFVDASEVDDL